MKRTIHLQHLWKIADISKDIKYHLKTTAGFKIIIITARILALLVTLHLILQLTLSKSFELRHLFDISILTASLFADKILIYMFVSAYKKTDYDNAVIEWEIGDDNVVYITKNFYEMKIRWNYIKGILDTPQCFLLYPQPNLFYWLPKKAFKSE